MPCVAGASAVGVALTQGAGAAGGSLFAALAALAAAFLAAAAAAVAALVRIPSSLPEGVDFVVPFCPWVPLAALAINVYLLASLAPLTWARFGVWLLLGSGIYFVSAHARRPSHVQPVSLTLPLPPPFPHPQGRQYRVA